MRRFATALGVLVASCGCGFALNPSVDISQYAHTAWTVRDGFALGNIYAIAQTPDGTSGSARSSACSASMAFAVSPGNHLPDSTSLTETSTACSSRATALSGLARLPALYPGPMAS